MALALTRKEIEGLRIEPPTGSPITVTVVRIGKRNVRLSVECDRDVRIERTDREGHGCRPVAEAACEEPGR